MRGSVGIAARALRGGGGGHRRAPPDRFLQAALRRGAAAAAARCRAVLPSARARPTGGGVLVAAAQAPARHRRSGGDDPARHRRQRGELGRLEFGGRRGPGPDAPWARDAPALRGLRGGAPADDRRDRADDRRPATDLPFDDERTVRLAPNHTVSGNPSRFTTGSVRIEADDAWRTAVLILLGGRSDGPGRHSCLGVISMSGRRKMPPTVAQGSAHRGASSFRVSCPQRGRLFRVCQTLDLRGGSRWAAVGVVKDGMRE